VFAVVVTGAPGSGKTLTTTVLSDALADDGIAHAGVDVDEVAWAYPYPSVEERVALLANAAEAHRRRGHELLLVAEVIESPGHLRALLESAGATDHLLVRLFAQRQTLRERIVAREPPGWSGLNQLLEKSDVWASELEKLDGIHLALDTEQHPPDELARRIRAERPDKLGG
jgi:chloramphenicol 3-O-phosphotransferase